jgi:branched-chain amino acid transport system substrate-binding protein
MGEGAREAAQKLGLQSGDLEVYSPGASDFTLLVAKARASGIEAWIAFAEGREPAEMVKNLKRLDYTPRLFFARSAQGPGFIQLVGQDAEFALSAQPYAPSFASPANSAFVTAYRAKWSAEPTVEAAEGYVAATVLAEAVRRAGSLERDKLRAALAALDMETVLGPYRVDPATGEQTAMAPAVLQIQKGRAQVVWPEPLQTGKAILPYPLWHERQVLRGGRR